MPGTQLCTQRLHGPQRMRVGGEPGFQCTSPVLLTFYNLLRPSFPTGIRGGVPAAYPVTIGLGPYASSLSCVTLGLYQPSAPRPVVPAPALNAEASGICHHSLVMVSPSDRHRGCGALPTSAWPPPAISWPLQPSPLPSRAPVPRSPGLAPVLLAPRSLGAEVCRHSGETPEPLW